jgi:ribosome-associated protein
MADVRVNSRVTIPEEELELRFSRSGGPGGQHANTSDTRAELRFDVGASAALSPEQKALIFERLGNRVSSAGVLVLSGDEYRSQTRNREAVFARFAALLADALTVTRPRRKTRRPASADQRRLEEKRRRADTKALRRPPEEA